MSLAELAFLLLFLVLLLSFLRIKDLGDQNKFLKGVAGKEAVLLAEVDKLKEKVRNLESGLKECKEMHKVLTTDPELPNDWQELVEGYRRLQADQEKTERLYEELEEEHEELKKAHEKLKRKNESLKGRLQNCLRGKNNNGLDHPPCWADSSTGATQYLYRVTVDEGSVTVEPNWPPSRNSEAEASAMILQGLGQEMGMAEFSAKMAPILDWSKREDPECRHFVRIRDRAVSKQAYKNGRLMIEDYFYKYEERR